MSKTNLTDGIKNIIFDLGGVIINIDHHRTANAFNQLDVPDFIDHFSHNKQHEIFDLHEKGMITDREFRTLVMTELKISVTESVFDEAWNAILLDIPKSRIDLLLKLKGRYRIFMLSNTNSIHMQWMDEYMTRTFNIPSYKHIFEKSYYSFELGMRKPESDIFLHVLNDSQLIPEETLFIDDSLPNIQSAERLGLKTFYYPKNADLLPTYLL